jgi:hypothetical protein
MGQKARPKRAGGTPHFPCVSYLILIPKLFMGGVGATAHKKIQSSLHGPSGFLSENGARCEIHATLMPLLQPVNS